MWKSWGSSRVGPVRPEAGSGAWGEGCEGSGGRESFAGMAEVGERVLVTGGAGFLGSWLVERLLGEGKRVVVVDDLRTGRRENVEAFLGREGFRFVGRDVCGELGVRGVGAIYHLACPASPAAYQRDPVGTLRTCFEGTRRVLELGRGEGARVLLASTSEVYGDPEEHPQTEGYWGRVNPRGPRSCYDEGKRAGEALGVAYGGQHGVEVRVARIFNTYGPRMAEGDGRVVSNFVVQALRGEALTVYGRGEQTRSFCYVEDLVEGLVRLMGSEEEGPVNLGNPEEVTVGELAARVVAEVGGASRVAYRELPGEDPVRRRPDIRKAERVLGWRPTVSLEEGLRRTVAEFRQRLGVG